MKQPKIYPACLLALLFVLSACGTQPNDLDVAKDTQAAVMNNAIAAEPAYRPTSFPARRDINRYLRETETLASEWYTYALNRDGEPIFYVVSDSKPRNICISITAPDRIVKDDWGNVVISAPALDGVYYGGAGCDAYYLWDSATGNFIELAGQNFTLLSTKAPLALETDPIRIAWQETDASE